MPKFKIGDKIALKDEDLSGEVLWVKGNQLTVLTEDGFEIPLSTNEVVLNPQSVDIKASMLPNEKDVAQKSSTKRTVPKRKKPKQRNQPAMEVDLHIHQLTQYPSKLTPHEMLTLQVEEAKRQLDFAIRKRIQKIVFIHGVGQGVLRAELEYLFRKYDNLKYYDADYAKYGVGALEVYVYQSKQP